MLLTFGAAIVIGEAVKLVWGLGPLPATIPRVLDGPLAPIPCASRSRYQRCEDCNEASCQVRHLMLEVRQAIAEVLDQRSLAEMRDIAVDDLSVALKIQA